MRLGDYSIPGRRSWTCINCESTHGYWWGAALAQQNKFCDDCGELNWEVWDTIPPEESLMM